jgi:hypothetical protein
MSRGPDAATQVARAIEGSRAGVVVLARESRPWASVTFSGARHRLTLDAGGEPGLETWVAGLPEREIALRGHLVADVAVTTVERAKVVIEVLTVEE